MEMNNKSSQSGLGDEINGVNIHFLRCEKLVALHKA